MGKDLSSNKITHKIFPASPFWNLYFAFKCQGHKMLFKTACHIDKCELLLLDKWACPRQVYKQYFEYNGPTGGSIFQSGRWPVSCHLMVPMWTHKFVFNLYVMWWKPLGKYRWWTAKTLMTFDRLSIWLMWLLRVDFKWYHRLSLVGLLIGHLQLFIKGALPFWISIWTSGLKVYVYQI